MTHVRTVMELVRPESVVLCRKGWLLTVTFLSLSNEFDTTIEAHTSVVNGQFFGGGRGAGMVGSNLCLGWLMVHLLSVATFQKCAWKRADTQ